MLSKTTMNANLLQRMSEGRATVGLELAKPDSPMLDYLQFFFAKVPVDELRFVHVVPKVEFFATREVTSLEMDEKILAAMQVQLSETFREPEKMNALLEVRAGNPLDELIRDINNEGAELAVIGQREDGRHNIQARKLARKAPCPVLVVPEEAEAKMDHIMVPIDFSNTSAEALQTALAIREAVNPQAQITCVHVYSMPDLSPYLLQRTPDEMRTMVENDRREAIDIFLRDHVGDDIHSVDTQLISKELPGIAHYLMEYADETEVDFIVIGAKGHSKLELLLLGSVTENLLVDNEEIPTLVVK